MKKVNKRSVYLSFLLFIASSLISVAQKNYSLQDCIDMALSQNELVKMSKLQIEQAQLSKKLSSEIPKTSVLYTQGQFNSIYQYDNNITISQTLPNPWAFSSKKKLAQAEIKKSELHLKQTQAELIHQVELCYYTLQYSNALHDLIHKQDSIYEVFAKDAAQKFKDGKGSLLEKTTAETQALESKNELTESEEDIENFRIELQTLMHIVEPIEISSKNFDKTYISLTPDTIFKNEHPLLLYNQQQIDLMDQSIKNEAAHIAPDITLGYFNQTIYGPANIFGEDYFLTTKNRLQGFQVGLTLPLWYLPMHAKVQAAKVNKQIANSEYNYHKMHLLGQYRQALTLYQKYHHSIDNYKNNIIGNFDLIVNQALSSYDSKTISYIEYLQIISHAIQFQKNYLNVIHQNNVQALKIKYLLSK